jgi:hypothetical protein
MLTGAMLDAFRSAWAKLDPQGTCFIPITQLNTLLSYMEPPLGFKDHPKQEARIISYLVREQMSTFNDHKDYHFHDIAKALSKMIYFKAHRGSIEGEEPIFEHLNKRREKLYPELKTGKALLTFV